MPTIFFRQYLFIFDVLVELSVVKVFLANRVYLCCEMLYAAGRFKMIARAAAVQIDSLDGKVSVGMNCWILSLQSS